MSNFDMSSFSKDPTSAQPSLLGASQIQREDGFFNSATLGLSAKGSRGNQRATKLVNSEVNSKLSKKK